MVLVMDDVEESNNNNNVERFDDFVLPGFRFHPTDEELVSFYLKRTVLHKSLPFELIKKVDIYKYDPWDLPKLAPMGEKEWYFYCPRDRKYRNSTRPNRVTGGGFWKATGTDRPIYSLDSTRCIGLKKSLVFYRGRAAKGVKTDWMMHEFRLPSLSDSHHTSYPSYNNRKQHLNTDKDVPSSDAWAICRIFKKTNSVSSQRSTPQSWVYPTIPEIHNQYNSHSHIVSTLSASSDVLSHIATRQNLLSSPVINEPGSFTESAAAYIASQMLGVPYNAAARNGGTGDALFLRNGENSFFNNLAGEFACELPSVRSMVVEEEETTASEVSATSYGTK